MIGITIVTEAVHISIFPQKQLRMTTHVWMIIQPKAEIIRARTLCCQYDKLSWHFYVRHLEIYSIPPNNL